MAPCFCGFGLKAGCQYGEAGVAEALIENGHLSGLNSQRIELGQKVKVNIHPMKKAGERELQLCVTGPTQSNQVKCMLKQHSVKVYDRIQSLYNRIFTMFKI